MGRHVASEQIPKIGPSYKWQSTFFDAAGGRAWFESRIIARAVSYSPWCDYHCKIFAATYNDRAQQSMALASQMPWPMDGITAAQTRGWDN